MPLQIELLNASRSSHAKSGPNLAQKKGDPWLFWWTIAIFVLLALTTFSWFASLYIFQHPENPKNYRLLAKFRKLEPLKKFDPLNVPRGRFHGAKEAYGKYFTYTDEELDTQNGLFKRSYIKNYAEEQPVYLKGTYRIYKVAELDGSRPFTSGLVIRAKSVELPNVSIEFVCPNEVLPAQKPRYGDDIVLSTNNFFASVMHVSRLPEESLCFTVVSLTYSPLKFGSDSVITLFPPERLNMAAEWPLTDDTPSEEVDTQLAATPDATAP